MTRADGSIDFHGLFGAAGARCEGVAYWAFDLLELDDEVLRSLPLVERKRRLARLVARARSDRLRVVEHFDDGGRLLAACAKARPRTSSSMSYCGAWRARALALSIWTKCQMMRWKPFRRNLRDFASTTRL
jgi:hypothetical protein